MDYLFLVGVVKGIANRREEFEPFGNAQLMRVAVVIQRLPFDKLHDEVGQAVVSCAAVQETGDVRMIERGQNLALVAKAPQDKVGIHAALDQLDRNALVEFLVDAQRFVDRAHAAAADLALNSISAQAAPDHRIVIVGFGKCLKRTQSVQFRFSVERLFEEVPGALVLRQQHLNLVQQRRVVCAHFRQVAPALFRNKIESRLENGFNLLPAFGGHRNRWR